jgi:hypothetical protein
MQDAAYTKALGDLQGRLAQLKTGKGDTDNIIGSREQVFAKYRPIFSVEHVPELSRDEFTSFLYFENNHHWSGLYRKGLQAAEDMERLRAGLGLLLDQNKPIRDRFSKALEQVLGIGKGIASGILLVAYPEQYGVWNNASESALRQLGIWPTFEKGEGIGAKYERINALLTRLKCDLDTDFWTLDALMWYCSRPQEELSGVEQDSQSHDSSFALERQLEEFLLENWDRTPLSKEWAIYRTAEEPEAGNQYPTDVGPIDILAVHKLQPRFLVIELKRKQSSDQTVGQLLRYIGWIKRYVAKKGESVSGLIIAHSGDNKVGYAIDTLCDVEMMTYEVEFRLNTWKLSQD